MTDPAFDAAAADYDGDFTNTAVGRAQRALVQGYLVGHGLVKPGSRVLEINCGTGADAVWMGQLGANVLATDLSGEMIAKGIQRREDGSRKGSEFGGTVEFRQMDLRAAAELPGGFDMVFSNFGGLNCLSPEEFKAFLAKLPALLWA